VSRDPSRFSVTCRGFCHVPWVPCQLPGVCMCVVCMCRPAHRLTDPHMTPTTTTLTSRPHAQDCGRRPCWSHWWWNACWYMCWWVVLVDGGWTWWMVLLLAAAGVCLPSTKVAGAHPVVHCAASSEDPSEDKHKDKHRSPEPDCDTDLDAEFGCCAWCTTWNLCWWLCWSWCWWRSSLPVPAVIGLLAVSRVGVGKRCVCMCGCEAREWQPSEP
jgi:hypothetical protein